MTHWVACWRQRWTGSLGTWTKSEIGQQRIRGGSRIEDKPRGRTPLPHNPPKPEAVNIPCPECGHREGMLTASTEVGSFYRCLRCEYVWQRPDQTGKPEPAGSPQVNTIEPDLEVRARELVMEAMAFGGEMWEHLTPATIDALVKAVAGDLREAHKRPAPGANPRQASKRQFRR
jgi:hypothetical protein